MVDVAVVCRGRNVFRCDMKRWRLGAEGVEHIRGEIRRQASRDVIRVVRVPAGFAAQNGDAAAGVLTWSICGEIEVKKFVRKGATIRCVCSSSRADGEDLVRASPGQGELGFEDEVVGIFLGSLSDGGGAVVDPRPVSHFEDGKVVEGLDKLGVSTLNARGSKGVELPN